MKVLRDLKKNQNEKWKNGSIVRSNNQCVRLTHCTNCLNAMHFHSATIAQCAGPNLALLIAAY